MTFLYQVFRFDLYLLTNYNRTHTSMRLFLFACLFCALTLSILGFYIPITTLGLNLTSLLSGAKATASILCIYTWIRGTFFNINAYYFNYCLIKDLQNELLNQIETPDNRDNIIQIKDRVVEILDNKINHVIEEEGAFYETYLNDCSLPERLCCPFTHSLMNFPIKGEDNHYYDLLQLTRYYVHQKMPYEKVPYPLNPSLGIWNHYRLTFIDKNKYLEIQNYKQSIFYAKSGWLKTTQSALTQGIMLSFITCCLALSYFGLLGCALASAAGFLTGVGVYFRTRYSVIALESVRQQKEALKNAAPSNDSIPDSDVFRLGKSASTENVAYFKSWLPSKTLQRTPYTDPEEWYAGFQAGIEEVEAENTILYSFNP